MFQMPPFMNFYDPWLREFARTYRGSVSRYMPHQGERECARRRGQMAKAAAKVAAAETARRAAAKKPRKPRVRKIAEAA